MRLEHGSLLVGPASFRAHCENDATFFPVRARRCVVQSVSTRESIIEIDADVRTSEALVLQYGGELDGLPNFG